MNMFFPPMGKTNTKTSMKHEHVLPTTNTTSPSCLYPTVRSSRCLSLVFLVTRKSTIGHVSLPRFSDREQEDQHFYQHLLDVDAPLQSIPLPTTYQTSAPLCPLRTLVFVSS